MSEGPTTGQILLGIFIILFGLCITLLGGGCTVLWLSMVGSSGSQGGVAVIVNPLFLLSLAGLAGGIVTLWVGFKLMTGRYKS